MKRILLYGLLLVAGATVQAQDRLPYPTDTIDGKVYYRYTVEKSIGLYRISKNFGVSQEAILQANPDLKKRGLVFEEVIRIPTDLPATEKKIEPAKPAKPLKPVEQKKSIAELILPKPQAEPEKPEKPEKPEVLENPEVPEVLEVPKAPDVQDSAAYPIAPDTLPVIEYTDTVRLAFMLPLQAEATQRNPMIDRFYDFYAGALLALKHHDPIWTDSLGAAHATYYDVHTYDVGKYGSEVCQLTDSGALANTDAVIGPVYLKPVEMLSAYANEHHLPVMVPFLQSLPTAVRKTPDLLKFNPSDDIHAHAMMEYLDTLRATTNIVLVDAYTNKLDYPAWIRILRDSIKARGFSTTSTTIRQILADSVSTALKDSVENILLFHSERYSNVQLLMPYLLSGKRNKQLTILCPYAWLSEKILLPQLYSTVFRTPDAATAERYEQDYKQYFGHPLSSTLPRYDMLGYDLTGYMLEALSGGTFHTLDTLYEGIQSSLLFNQIDNGGYENAHIVIERR